MALPGNSRGALAKIVVTVALICATRASAATYRVPEDVDTIQGGLDMAQPGDTVLVSPGRYFENLLMRDHIVLRSAQGAELTVVQALAGIPVIRCESVDGFTVQDLTLADGFIHNFPGGAGVSMYQSQGMLLGCIIGNNHASYDGGGLGVVDSDVTVRNSIFINNSVYAGSLDGGGIYSVGSILLVENCQFVRNEAHEGGAIAIVNSTQATIRNSIFTNNEATSGGVAGSAVITVNSPTVIESNTIVGNTTFAAGASVVLYGGNALFTRNIIANATGVGIICGGVGLALLQCNDVWNSQGSNYEACTIDPMSFSADPMFCDYSSFTLNQSSPCAPPNSPPGCDLIGARGVGCGAVSVSAVTWGHLKHIYQGAVTKR